MRAEFSVLGCRSLSFGNDVLFFRAVEDGIEVARVIHESRDLRNSQTLPRRHSVYDHRAAGVIVPLASTQAAAPCASFCYVSIGISCTFEI